jgi:hypothetical protein
MPTKDGITFKRDPGRPPDDPYFKASIAQRALFSPATMKCVTELMKELRLGPSNFLRLAVWNMLKAYGKHKTLDTENDNTWKDLHEAGLL